MDTIRLKKINGENYAPVDEIHKLIAFKEQESEKEITALKDCVILIQSILSASHFEIETPNEAALVKALEIVGYPVTVDKDKLDPDHHYKTHKTFINELIDENERLMKGNK